MRACRTHVYKRCTYAGGREKQTCIVPYTSAVWVLLLVTGWLCSLTTSTYLKRSSMGLCQHWRCCGCCWTGEESIRGVQALLESPSCEVHAPDVYGCGTLFWNFGFAPKHYASFSTLVCLGRCVGNIVQLLRRNLLQYLLCIAVSRCLGAVC